jgi:hypothetical protein
MRRFNECQAGKAIFINYCNAAGYGGVFRWPGVVLGTSGGRSGARAGKKEGAAAQAAGGAQRTSTQLVKSVRY